MPTDFVAKWLSFMGRWALHWAELKEPEDERTRDFLLLSLGVASLGVAVVLMVGIMPTLASVLTGVLSVQDTPEWFYKVGKVVRQALVGLIVTPPMVGWIYGHFFAKVRKKTRRMARAGAASFVFLLMAIGAMVLMDSRGVLLSLTSGMLIPGLIALCPSYPLDRKHRHRLKTMAGRFKVWSRRGPRATA